VDHQFSGDRFVDVGGTTVAASAGATAAAAIGASAVRRCTTVVGAARATTGTIITHVVIRGENLEISGITTRSGSKVEKEDAPF
jgi:hypothetical protein